MVEPVDPFEGSELDVLEAAHLEAPLSREVRRSRPPRTLEPPEADDRQGTVKIAAVSVRGTPRDRAPCARTASLRTMRSALAGLSTRRRPLATGAAVTTACIAALALGQALTPAETTPAPAPPTREAQRALDRLGVEVDPLSQARRRARAAVALAATALADGSPRRQGLIETARERAVTSRLALLALTDGASDDERRAIGDANRALQRLVLQLDTAP